MKRRTFLNKTLGTGALLLAGGAGALKSLVVHALEWPTALFEIENEPDVVKSMFGDAEITESSDVVIKAPLQAENGAVVPIKVSTTLPDTKMITIMVEKNPVPLISSLNLGESAGGFYSARIKMGETSNVTAYVSAGDKVYKASQEIKVTVGGCGG